MNVPTHPTAPTAARVRIVTTSQWLDPLGGVEVCTVEDASSLADRGHRVTTAFGHDGSLRARYEAAHVSLAGPVRFEVNPRRPLAAVAAALPAARLVRGTRPDVLVLTRIEHLGWGLAVTRLARCPLICHLHGPPVFHRMRVLGAGVAHFIAVSDYIRDAYVRLGVRSDRISVVHNGISVERYPSGGPAERASARARLGLPADRKIVLCYGQMTADKGVAVLAEAWPQVRRARPGALLVLVNSLPTLEDDAVLAGLGRLDPSDYRLFPATLDVVPFLHASDVVAFPTLLPESFGRVAVEAMATGRPVIASRIGALPEVLAGPLTRFLVEPGSAPELAAGLTAVLDWRSREPDLGATCTDLVAERFALGEHVDRMERIIVRHSARRRTAPGGRKGRESQRSE